MKKINESHHMHTDTEQNINEIINEMQKQRNFHRKVKVIRKNLNIC